MYYETINKERLMEYRKNVKWLDELNERKKGIQQSLGLKSTDLSKIKVSNGDSRYVSEEERRVIRLEKINKEITRVKAIVDSLFQEFDTQITRVKSEKYRFILREHFIDNVPRKEMIDLLYGNEAYKEDKFRKKFDRLRDAAIKALQQVSTKPFIAIDRQLIIEDDTC